MKTKLYALGICLVGGVSLLATEKTMATANTPIILAQSDVFAIKDPREIERLKQIEEQRKKAEEAQRKAEEERLKQLSQPKAPTPPAAPAPQQATPQPAPVAPPAPQQATPAKPTLQAAPGQTSTSSTKEVAAPPLASTPVVTTAKVGATSQAKPIEIKNSDDAPITEVFVRSGFALDKVGLSKDSGVGGNGGQESKVSLKNVASIKVSYGDFDYGGAHISNLLITYTDGKTASVGTGQAFKNVKSKIVPINGKPIVGILVSSDGWLVESLQFKLR